MCSMSERIGLIEEIVCKSVRRDISRMTAFSRGQIELAAKSILLEANPHIVIVSGFFIRHAQPPSPETDGLNGTAHLASALTNAGIKTTVVTDAPCAKAMWAILTAAPKGIDLEVVDVREDSARELRARLVSRDHAPTHLVAIERVSPGTDGLPHREHGWDMTKETAPLNLLFQEDSWTRPWRTIGIGDGGNEIGMGALPKEIIKNDIPNGPLIAASVATDYLIVAGVSNWGAYGLIGALELLREGPVPSFFGHFNAEMETTFLRAAVELGQAIDDSRPDRPGKPQMSVDRIPVTEHAALIEQIKDVVGRYNAGHFSAERTS